LQQIQKTVITKKYGPKGELSNQIEFYRTEAEGDWTLKEDITLTCIVKGIDRGAIGNTYGIRRKIANNTNSKWERILDNAGLVANATHNGEEAQNDFNNIYPWSDIITYNYNTLNKEITAYYGEPRI